MGRVVSEKDKNPIKLHDFGEAIVSTIIEKMGFDQFLIFLQKFSFCPHSDKNEQSRRKDEKLQKLSTMEPSLPLTETMVSLILKDNLETDTEHDIDVAVFGKNNRCFPIEVKMGEAGALQSWAKFRTYMLAKAMKKRVETNNIYIDGSMSSFLAGLQKEELGNIIEYPSFDGVWGLCIRQSRKKNFIDTDVVTGFDNVPLIFTFEELINFYDAHFGSDAYKELVRKVLSDAEEYLCKEISDSLPKNS